MIVGSIPVPGALPALRAEPLTREAFAPFGEAISNPCPDRRPADIPASAAAAALPFGGVSANQGTAIQYRALASVRELYARAPSASPATPRLTMFVCGARDPVAVAAAAATAGDGDGSGGGGGSGSGSGGGFEVAVLERHPFTSQTFIPLCATAAPEPRYLVVVAPTLLPTAGAEADVDAELPAPEGDGLPGRGMPDLGGLRAFVASGPQAVTYAAGTWHAPMMALGPPGSSVDFLVLQFANDVPAEDCQEVGLEGEGRVVVWIPEEGRGSAGGGGGGGGAKL